MVILCLLLVVCVLSRLMSPWGPSDLEQQHSLSMQAVPSRVRDIPPEWKLFLPRQRTRPEATCESTGVRMLNQAPGRGLGYYSCFLVAARTTSRWIVLIFERGMHTSALTQAHSYTHTK